MSDKRPNSPISENTLIDIGKQCGVRFRFGDSDSDSDRESNVDSSSESESSYDDPVDDTDEDPSYDPNEAGTSSAFQQRGNRPLQLPRPNVSRDMSSDSEEDEDQPRPRPVVQRGGRPSTIGRPRGRQNVAQNDEESSSWDEVEEGNDPTYNHQFTYAELSGPKHCPPQNSKPIDYFNLFFTTTILTSFVTETNRYARSYINSNQNNLSPFSRVRKWVDVTLLEMKAFLSIIINMGMITKPSITSYWDTDFTQSTPFFAKVMPCNRFQIILKFFHIVDVNKLIPRGNPGYDPCGRFQPIIDHANRMFKHYYYPTQALSVDESLVGTKKRVALTQYLPKKKHHKWGIKLWVLCDSITRYCVSFYCYKGAQRTQENDRIVETGLGSTVVMTLLQMANCLGKGHHMYLDNFFTSISLARNLYTNKTFMTGTLRKDRKGIPKKLLGKYAVGQKTYVRKGPLLIMAHREKPSNASQFLILSTDCQAATQNYSIRRSGRLLIKNKTKIAYQYNRGMGGIDSTDQMLYVYMDERRTMKHAKKVIFNVFGRMMLNAFILHKLNTTESRITRAEFMKHVIRDLATEWLATKNVQQNPQGGGDATTARYGLRKLPEKKEKLCRECSGVNHPEGKKRRSRTVCIKCGNGVHAECLVKHVCV